MTPSDRWLTIAEWTFCVLCPITWPVLIAMWITGEE